MVDFITPAILTVMTIVALALAYVTNHCWTEAARNWCDHDVLYFFGGIICCIAACFIGIVEIGLIIAVLGKGGA